MIVEDSTARTAYGYRRLGISTQLAEQTPATELANRILARNRAFEWRVPQLVWDTVIGGGDAESLLGLLDSTGRIAAPISVTDLPDWTPIGDALVTWLEGGTYEYDDAWSLELNVTPGSAVGASVKWNELDPAWAWNEFDPSIDWRDLVAVGT